jgi:hypothetical protein
MKKWIDKISIKLVNWLLAMYLIIVMFDFIMIEYMEDKR